MEGGRIGRENIDLWGGGKTFLKTPQRIMEARHDSRHARPRTAKKVFAHTSSSGLDALKIIEIFPIPIQGKVRGLNSPVGVQKLLQSRDCFKGHLPRIPRSLFVTSHYYYWVKKVVEVG